MDGTGAAPAGTIVTMGRPVITRRLLVTIAGGLTLLSAACSTPTPSRSELADALVDSGIPAPVARCTAEAITESFDDDQLARIVERGPGGAPADDPDRTDDATDKVRDALAACRAQLPTTTTTSTATLPVATTQPVGGSVDGSAAPTDEVGPGVSEDDGASFDTVPP